MTKTKAKMILNNIFEDDVDPEEKLLAIQEIVDMETHNSVTKQQMIDALNWLINDYI